LAGIRLLLVYQSTFRSHKWGYICPRSCAIRKFPSYFRETPVYSPCAMSFVSAPIGKSGIPLISHSICSCSPPLLPHLHRIATVSERYRPSGSNFLQRRSRRRYHCHSNIYSPFLSPLRGSDHIHVLSAPQLHL